MKPRYSNYPIGKLLLHVIDQSGLSPKEFFAELGFNNFSKALERLDCWLAYGEGNQLLIERLQSSRFAIDRDRLTAAMAENDVLLQREREVVARREEDEARQSFRPHVEVIPELSRPTQITMFCFTGGNQRFNIGLPDDISAWTWEDQLAYLKQVVPENFAKHRGRTFFTGSIVGYLYRPTFDGDPIWLTITGEIDTQGEPISASRSVAYLRWH
ncbi:hypothetical protein FSO04_05225 [Paraburkholderia madseniana]|uniref:Uncharacterized protein n=1 Tax=Paraburkholderia madseniana TaxID=2599607 RepID=A0A6N6WPB3_9BURK|nr:hypothetical protein [Paraburkholderia madseniana]KAE8761120.1 hypothetical protein FSO04_05225 [Paraburkholderia madseniana]